jgi:hypothetical protein
MKKLTVLFTVVAFLIAGAMFHSCKKDELQNVNPDKNLAIKDAPAPYYDIMMGQNLDIGDVYIGFTCSDLTINADFDEAVLLIPEERQITINETHLYVGDVVPPYGPGKFTVPWDDNNPESWGWSFTLENVCTECQLAPGYFEYNFHYYFALHFQIIVEYWVELYDPETMTYYMGWGNPEEETAWMLDPDPEHGFNFMKKNAIQGWGKYYDLEFIQECPTL